MVELLDVPRRHPHTSIRRVLWRPACAGPVLSPAEHRRADVRGRRSIRIEGTGQPECRSGRRLDQCPPAAICSAAERFESALPHSFHRACASPRRPLPHDRRCPARSNRWPHSRDRAPPRPSSPTSAPRNSRSRSTRSTHPATFRRWILIGLRVPRAAAAAPGSSSDLPARWPASGTRRTSAPSRTTCGRSGGTRRRRWGSAVRPVRPYVGAALLSVIAIPKVTPDFSAAGRSEASYRVEQMRGSHHSASDGWCRRAGTTE